MTEEPEHVVHEGPVPLYRRDIVLFIGSSVLIAFVLVLVSLALYNSSGAAQLDLSRPGYVSVQGQVDRTDTFESFPATGPVTNSVLDQFQKLFDRQVKPVDNTEAFNPASLDDEALGIDAPTADN
jgi:hypothetical protein